MTGRATCFRLAERKGALTRVEERGCRRLRLKQRKKAVPIAKFLISLGVKKNAAWMLAGSEKGWWRIALSPKAHSHERQVWG